MPFNQVALPVPWPLAVPLAVALPVAVLASGSDQRIRHLFSTSHFFTIHKSINEPRCHLLLFNLYVLQVVEKMEFYDVRVV